VWKYSRTVRALVVLVDVAIVLLVAYLVYSGVAALTRGRQLPLRLPLGGRWQPRHYAHDGHTVVAVARMTPAGEVIEEHVVARILDSDSDWSRKFLNAKEEAEERAFHLNADGSS
jgi:pyridoxamine 5'-phosphate oxidase family protein